MGAIKKNPSRQPQQRLNPAVLSGAVLFLGAIASCSVSSPGNASSSDSSSSTSPSEAPAEVSENETSMPSEGEILASASDQPSRELSSEWVPATAQEEEAQWSYILNSPLGIAALNQLAIEGFINPLCEKSFYINQQYGGFQSLMKVECSSPRGASTAVGYDEVHVIFNRFESNIENFEIRRFGES
ncbi:MAG: hypothetical protein WBA57_14710 [Elainellaceae cyanobacterium]